MSRIDELRERIARLEQAVNHLTSHHDAEYLVVHDDVSEDTCKRLYTSRTRKRGIKSKRKQ